MRNIAEFPAASPLSFSILEIEVRGVRFGFDGSAFVEWIQGLVRKSVRKELAEIASHGPADVDETAAHPIVPSAEPSRSLTAAEAAGLLGVSERFMYKHASELPFARRIGRTVRFDEAGLIEWKKRNR